MRTQKVEFGAEARKKLMKGIDTLTDAVVTTLGPNGRNVIYNNNGVFQSTKDGVSVAKRIVALQDPIEDLGVQLIKQASIKTADHAGDGTTTSTLLAREMVKSGLKFLNNGENAVEIKRGIDKAVKQIVETLRTEIAEDISSEDQIKQVAAISSNNDVEIGNLIATALEKSGHNGIVHIEDSKTHETYLKTVEGLQFDRGYKSHFFVTDNTSMTCYLKDTYILIADHKFTTAKELLPVLEYISTSNKSLLIIAEEIEHEALATLIVNKGRGVIKVAAVKAPDFGERRKLVLEDIAILTGGKVFDKNKGMKLEKFDKDWLGQASTVTVTKDQTTIIDGKGKEEDIANRVGELQSQVEKSTTPFEIEKLQERLAKMVGGVSIIYVGGYNETEMNEKKDRVDDALNATKAALEEGIVPGGGAALLHARNTLEINDIGAQIVYDACGKPFETILTNAGYDNIDAQIHGKIIGAGDKWDGYNLKTDDITNMKEAGIIDPLKVTRTALENAAAVASTILLTEACIIDLPEENKNVTPDLSGMEGMFG
jgi:chaperonin GroEL